MLQEERWDEPVFELVEPKVEPEPVPEDEHDEQEYDRCEQCEADELGIELEK